MSVSDEQRAVTYGIGPIRAEGDLSPYTSGEFDLPEKDRITHQVEAMLVWHQHYDRVVWALRTREGRVIVVMQERHEADPDRVGGQIELINAPFRDTAIRDTAIKGLREDIEDFAGLVQIIEGS